LPSISPECLSHPPIPFHLGSDSSAPINDTEGKVWASIETRSLEVSEYRNRDFRNRDFPIESVVDIGFNRCAARFCCQFPRPVLVPNVLNIVGDSNSVLEFYRSSVYLEIYYRTSARANECLRCFSTLLLDLPGYWGSSGCAPSNSKLRRHTTRRYSRAGGLLPWLSLVDSGYSYPLHAVFAGGTVGIRPGLSIRVRSRH